MSAWGEVFLGVIALATLATAVVQIGVLIAAALLVRRLQRLTERAEEQIKPLFVHLDTIGREASRASVLAGAQVERVDALVSDLLQSVEQAVRTVQTVAAVPAREGAALLAGLRAVFGTLRNGRRARPRSRGEDEDTLFI